MMVKICGITNSEDAIYCESAGAEILGFIFYSGSKRYIDPLAALEIIQKLKPGTKKVGVFVNEELEVVNKIVKELQLDFVQLHGEETPEYTGQVKCKTIKAFRVMDRFDFGIIDKYGASIPLFDTFSNNLYGGTGEKFDWNLIPGKLKGQYFLSGGISTENIKEVAASLRPFAVDVNSSLEKEPGIKDHNKVKDFFDLIGSLVKIKTGIDDV
ncbi:phosphoribosylanthranilate isomerase [Ignavibacteriales bacterium]